MIQNGTICNDELEQCCNFSLRIIPCNIRSQTSNLNVPNLKLIRDIWSGPKTHSQLYHVALTIYPDHDSLSNVPRSGYSTTRDQSMVESGVTEGGKNTASFPFHEWTQQLEHKHEASSYKATIFKVIPEEKQQLVEEEDADDIRKVLCKSFIQWF